MSSHDLKCKEKVETECERDIPRTRAACKQ